MGCDFKKGPDGATYILCSRGKHPGSRTKCCACNVVGAPMLCDGRAPPGSRTKTCDAPLCLSCASEIGSDRHLCPWCAHAARGQRP